MTGMAKKLFAEETFKRFSPEFEKPVRWPLLEKMLMAKRLGYVDLALAHQLLGFNGDEALATLICHLSMVSRQGHICVKIEDGRITPSPNDIWIVDEIQQEEEFSSVDFDKISALILHGAKNVASPLICNQQETANLFHSPLIKNYQSYYLQRYWHLETLFLKSIKRLFADNQVIIPVNDEVIRSRVNEELEKGKLLPEQASAILTASKSSLTFITGGPGTGKTYTAGMLLKILWEALEIEKQKDFKIVLAAPTGKAAANLETSIQQALITVKDFPSVKAQTLHQLLGIKRNDVNQRIKPLTADLILVDESSMIDIHLMGQLFTSLKPGARLILLGDRYQLPSIEAGSLFADIITYFLSNPQKQSQVVELKTCLRAELKSIIELANQIKLGNDKGVFHLLEQKKEGINFVSLEKGLSSKEQQKRLLQYAIPRFPIITKLPENPLDLLKQFARFRILTPLRKGPLGVDTLNALIFQAIKGGCQNECFIAPIMVLQNDYRRDLFNGEVGLLIQDQKSEFAVFTSRDSTQTFRKIPILLMPRFEYAYCLSVHKSQGSEFDHVVLLLPEGTQNFRREGVYTGITRAKRRLEIWSQPEVLFQMMNQVAVRQSGVIERLST